LLLDCGELMLLVFRRKALIPQRLWSHNMF